MIGGKAGCDKVEGRETVNAAILSFPEAIVPRRIEFRRCLVSSRRGEMASE